MLIIYLIKIFNQSIGTYAEQQQKKELFESEIRLQPNILRFYNSGGTFIKLPNRDHSVFFVPTSIKIRLIHAHMKRVILCKFMRLG